MTIPVSSNAIKNSINAFYESASKISRDFAVNLDQQSLGKLEDDAIVNDIVSLKMSENEIKAMTKVIKVEDEVEKNLIDIIA